MFWVSILIFIIIFFLLAPFINTTNHKSSEEDVLDDIMQDIDKEGNASIKKMMPIGFTIDERIADGFYFAKSFKIFRHLIENPELLDRPLQEPIDFTV